ncbi:LysR family transcriptional regulator [Lysinibacillus sp. KU-BSD001]|uniref:LysR family transcriptional regulator n=1 Tax=Lysinibacillus sp. KU-BSD001 TaxID=3141328 RepID=UPI0036EBC749
MFPAKLEYIIEVAKMKSINKAAKSLNVTQPTISQAIYQMEEEIGFPLFIRSKSGTYPSEKGKDIIKKAVEILEKFEELDALFGYTKVTEELRLAAIPGVMLPLVKTVTNYKKSYPNIEIFLTEGSSEEVIKKILDRELDAGLIVQSSLFHEEINDLIFEPVVKGKMVAVASHRSPYAKEKFITVEQLKEENLIFYKDDHVKHFEAEFTRKYGNLNILFRTNNVEAIILGISEQNAMSVGHDYSLYFSQFYLEGKLVPLEIKGFEQLPVQIGWIRNKHIPLSPQVKNFISRYKMAQVLDF